MGISMSTGEYVLTLNPDVVLSNNFLLEANNNINKLGNDVGMIGVKILKANSEKIIDSTGLVLSNAFRFFDRGSGEKDMGQYDKSIDILGPCAAAAIYKRGMLEDVKLNGEYFDKDFFYLIEDFDIALRAKRKGWKGAYLPDVVCYHERNGSGMAYKYRQYYAFRNRYFLIMKNIKIRPFFIFYFLIYDIPRFIFLFFTNFRILCEIINLVRSFRVMLKKRQIILNTADF
jgi:GT2 family glycosyltransferase